ncbi:galactofuranosyltransferase GlfT1 [Gordonia iterans]
MTGTVIGVVVTHRRRELLAESLSVLSAQDRPLDHLIVVDNAAEPEVADLVAAQPVPTTYLASRHNLGGAGGFALGMLHALALGADWIWCADDDGRPEGPQVLSTLLRCAQRHSLGEVSPVVANIDDPDALAFPLRRGMVWRRRRSELFDDAPSTNEPSSMVERAQGVDTTSSTDDLLPGIASLMNGALFAASTLDRIGVPDLRLFVRGDEVEMHRRLTRSGIPFGTCLTTAYLHPDGSDEFRPILGGRMHTQYPDNAAKRFFTYRNRGYLMSQPGMRKLLPQEYARFGWYFLVQQRDVAGFREWLRLRRLGRRERFGGPDD